jgi:hypothetical protein
VRITAVPCGNVTAADSARVAKMPSTDPIVRQAYLVRVNFATTP